MIKNSHRSSTAEESPRTTRFFQFLLIGTFVTLSWLGFMIVHEFGHVVAGWATGADVSRVVLHPLQISWTSFTTNPNPLLVAWGGPALGCVFPLILLVGVNVARLSGRYLIRFFAGFCLVANGLYLLVDAFERGGDGGTLLKNGASQWQLILFGLIITPVGFRLWDGLGSSFGLGASDGRVSRRAALASTVSLALVVALELAFYR